MLDPDSKRFFEKLEEANNADFQKIINDTTVDENYKRTRKNSRFLIKFGILCLAIAVIAAILWYLNV